MARSAATGSHAAGAATDDLDGGGSAPGGRPPAARANERPLDPSSAAIPPTLSAHPPRTSSRARTSAIAATLAIVPLLVFAPILWGQAVALRDFPSWTWPSRALWRAAVLEGRLPQWNPYVGLGAPMAAAPVQGLFYPGHLLLLLAPPLLAVGLLWIAHVVLAGAGGYRLARRLGCRPAVALASAFAWQIGGYALSMWGNGEKVLTGAFVPWAAFALIESATARRPARASAATALVLGLMALAGDPFLWMHALLLGAASAWALAADEVGPGRAALRVFGRSALAVAGALLVAAAALLPALALFDGSDRVGGLARAAAERWSLQPQRVIDLLAPDAGGPGANEWAPALYVGALAALGTLTTGFGRQVRALWVVGALGLLLALGAHTPVHQLARTLLPPLAYLRYPEKHLLVTVGALALLGALGIERALALSALPLRRLGIAAAAVVGLTVLAGARTTTPLPAGAVHLALAVAALIGVLWTARRSPRAAWLLPLVAAGELLLAALPQLQWVNGERLLHPPAALADVLATADVPPPRLYHALAAGGDPSSLPDNVGAPWGLAHVPGHESGQSGRLRRLWASLSGRGGRVVDLLDVGWLALPPGPPPPQAIAMQDLEGDDRVPARLYRLPAGARLHLVGSARVLDDEAALSAMTSPSFSADSEALLAPDPAAVPLAATGATGACHYDHFVPERVALACDVRGGQALLVMADGYARGWSASVDGRPAPVLRADFTLRAVPLGPGAHEIVLTYRTPRLFLGIALSALGFLLCAAPLLRRRPPAPTSAT